VPLKKTLRDLLEEGHFEQIEELAEQRRRVLPILVALTFDGDAQIAWRAIEALGVAARRVAGDDPDFVREHLRRLYWLISEESGGICWRAPEAMAEIVRHEPQLFSDYIPIVVFLITSLAEEDLEHFKAGALWAIGRLGPLASDHVEEIQPAVMAALDDPDPQIRGTAVWCLGQVGRATDLANRSDLLCDEGPVSFYEDGSLAPTSVAELARRALTEEATEA
jgi:HEAT repeat protein